MKIRTNFIIFKKWKKQLDQIARVESVKQKRNITYSELIRQALKEKYNLGEEE